MTFFVGQKVVCIDDTFDDPRWKNIISLGIVLPKKGPVYTIRRIYPTVVWADASVKSVGLHLEELINPELSFMKPREIPFCALRFRPLIEKKSQTDISFALDILDKANRSVKEPQRA